MFNNYEIVEYTQPSIPDPELHRPDHTGRPGAISKTFWNTGIRR